MRDEKDSPEDDCQDEQEPGLSVMVFCNTIALAYLAVLVVVVACLWL